MKKSICTSGFKDWSIEQVLAWAAPLGIDGLELWIGHIERFQAEHGPLEKLKALMQQYRFHVPIISAI